MTDSTLFYCRVYLHGIRDLYTWSGDESTQPGDRVEVFFRGRRRLGIVVDISSEVPDFKVQPIVQYVDRSFLPSYSLELAKQIAETTFSSVGKVLSFMIPEDFLRKKNPEKRDIVYRLVETYHDTSLLRGKKQQEVLTLLQDGEKSEESLREVVSMATLKVLLEKNFIEKEERGLRRIRSTKSMKALYSFTPLQKEAYDSLKAAEKPVLLWGVTGSGKTEIYRHLAQEVLDENSTGQVLFLVPEIALTDQFIASFQEMFGHDLAVWHSKLSTGEKIQEWLRVTQGEARILIGARSACMVPLRDPALLIVDEEHEWTYKNEFAPRFWTRDVILKVKELVETHGHASLPKNPSVRCVFGSATPSLWALAQGEEKQMEIVRLSQRVHSHLLPEIRLIDLRKEMIRGNATALSESLVKELKKTLSANKQAVLFLNKRGLAGSVQCKSCGNFRECPNCSYALKLHERFGKSLLVCHVCGHTKHFSETCSDCGEERSVFKGWGTQQVENQLKELFPQARIARADRDTITRKHDFTQMYHAMKNREIDILLGTQMVAKGLDFADVDLVGILLADVGLGLPDYMAEERAFQLLTQVAGRAGRAGQRSHILVQTFRPEEPLFQALATYDIDGFYDFLQKERRLSGMPPYGDLIKITFDALTKEEASKKAKKLFRWLEAHGHASVEYFMAPAFFPKMHGKYHWHVFVQSTDKTDLLDFIRLVPIELLGKVDVNPVSLL